MTPLRSRIIDKAVYWAAPGIWKPAPSDLISFFKGAKCEQAPSMAEATRSLQTLNYGAYIGTSIKHWCGIWACSVMNEVGLSLKWSLMNGMIKTVAGSGVTKVWGHAGIQPGDIAVVNAGRHHFIITDVSGPLVNSIDGNSTNNSIRTVTGKQLSTIVAYYRVND